jgi:hypothetical protein
MLFIRQAAAPSEAGFFGVMEAGINRVIERKKTVESLDQGNISKKQVFYMDVNEK